MRKPNYTAAELYKKAFGNLGEYGWATPNEINEFQAQHPEMRAENILLSILKKKILSEKSVIRVYPMYANLKQIYMWLGDEKRVEATQRIINSLDKPFQEEIAKEQKQLAMQASKLMGIPTDELIRMEEKARAEVLADDSWEKELNERNKARAGIVECE